MVRTELNESLSSLFQKQVGDDVSITLMSKGLYCIETKAQSTLKSAMDFAVAAGHSLIEGDWDAENRMYWCNVSYAGCA
jgi:hypothetical protein